MYRTANLLRMVWALIREQERVGDVWKRIEAPLSGECGGAATMVMEGRKW